MNRAVQLSVALLLICGTQRVASADPLLITGGDAIVGTTPFLVTSVRGNNFDAFVVWKTPSPSAFPTLPFTCDNGGCRPGSTINLSTTVFNSHINVPPAENTAAGSMVIDGVAYPGIAFAGSLSFIGPLVTLPAIGNGRDALFVEPFTLTGTLTAFRVLDVREPVELFTTRLSGAGAVRVALVGSPVSGTYSFGEMRYEFRPVPEPATIMLVGIGAIVAGMRNRGNLRRHSVTAPRR